MEVSEQATASVTHEEQPAVEEEGWHTHSKKQRKKKDRKHEEKVESVAVPEPEAPKPSNLKPYVPSDLPMAAAIVAAEEEADHGEGELAAEAEEAEEEEEDHQAEGEEKEGPVDMGWAEEEDGRGKGRGKDKREKKGQQQHRRKEQKQRARDAAVAEASHAVASVSAEKKKEKGKHTEAAAAAAAGSGASSSHAHAHRAQPEPSPLAGMDIPAGITRIDGYRWRVEKGFVSGMKSDVVFFANDPLAVLALEEMHTVAGGFLPAVKQLANVACLPGIVGSSLGMPDIHSGYGFAVGCVAATDMDNPEAVVSPGGVGFDINCGVRLLRTNIKASQLDEKKLKLLANKMFDQIPTGVGAEGAYSLSDGDLRLAMARGMRWALEKGYCWEEDVECCEEGGCMPDADVSKVSTRARRRGIPQLGTLGSGNHYIEIQQVDEVFDQRAADAMGLEKGTVCVMIHSGSRGLGHQVCTDYLQQMEEAGRRQGIHLPDKQLTSVRINSEHGRDYLAAMAAASNFAFVNRTLMANTVRRVFQEVLGLDAKSELGMHMVYDVAHNIAKQETHTMPDGSSKRLLVHRKGATRAFGPGHPQIPAKYREVGQPVLIGGSMGTCSYVLTGTDRGMRETFGSTCHGAGRALSRSQALRELKSQDVLAKLNAAGILVRVASPKLVAEEADEAYKDVESVIETCHHAGISKKTVRLRPLAVIKG